MKSAEQIEVDSKIRITIDFLISIILAIVTQLFMNWKFLFIFSAIYAFIKANLLYNYLNRIPGEFLMTIDTQNELKAIEDSLEKENYIKGFKQGYLQSKWVIQLFLTFVLVIAISSFTKFLFGFAMSSTLWLILFILFELSTIYLTLKKIWK